MLYLHVGVLEFGFRWGWNGGQDQSTDKDARMPSPSHMFTLGRGHGSRFLVSVKSLTDPKENCLKSVSSLQDVLRASVVV